MNYRRIFLVLISVVLVAQGLTYAKTNKTSLDEKFDEVWGKNRKIKVIQHRIFEKVNRWEFSLFAGTIPNDTAFNYYPLGLRIEYFPFEQLGIEINGAYALSSKTTMESWVTDRHLEMMSIDRMLAYAGLNGFWAPIHGKFSFMNIDITHYDIGINFGVGAVFRQSKNSAAATSWKNETPTVYGELGIGAQVFLNQNWALRLDYRHYFYKFVYSGVAKLAEITVGIGWFTKAPK